VNDEAPLAGRLGEAGGRRAAASGGRAMGYGLSAVAIVSVEL
jgi:hypothetical protein